MGPGRGGFWALFERILGSFRADFESCQGDFWVLSGWFLGPGPFGLSLGPVRVILGSRWVDLGVLLFGFWVLLG